MKLAVIYGSPTPPGKLARGLSLVERYMAENYPNWTTDFLASVSKDGAFKDWSENAQEKIFDADAVVIASPVFRGSFPWPLKKLIDMLPNAALRSKPVGIFTVAAAPHHFLSAERHLRDVMAWFGALTTPNSFFAVDKHFASEEIEKEIVDDAHEFTEQLVNLAERNAGLQFGPDPLHVKVTAKS